MSPKYTLAEIERRWLVQLPNIEPLAGLAVRQIEDHYLVGGRIRLRKVVDTNASATYKLGKKYGKSNLLCEPVVTIYLTEAEYEVMSNIPGKKISKSRYSLNGGSLDVYKNPKLSFAVFEVEFSSAEEAISYSPPDFAGIEITGNERYSGFALSESAG